MSDIREKEVKSISGIPFLFLLFAVVIAAAFVLLGLDRSGQRILIVVLAVPFFLIGISGLYKVEPNQSAVLSLFGKYVGTVRTSGLRFNNPFYTKKKISLRVRNFESGKLKVNELDGSPIEIAAIVVWEVNDSAEAVFNVDDYESFVQIQSEAAIRAMATSYPYVSIMRKPLACAHTRRLFQTACATKFKTVWPKPASMSSRRGFLISLIRQKLLARCCSANRPARLLPRAN